MASLFKFGENPQQDTFYDEVLNAVFGKSPNRFFFYGGGIRGGKTTVCLVTIYALAAHFPGFRAHIIRESFPVLADTTIKSWFKFFPANDRKVDHVIRDKSNYHVTFKNGSEVHFKAENIKQDPNLDWMLGLETNLIFLEQVEELSKTVFQRAIERAGSWYIDPMPPPLILATFNPTQRWVKDDIYEPYKNGELESPYYYINALPKHNPYVTDEQWAAWKMLDPIKYQQMIEGDWSAFPVDKPFAYCFDPNKHVTTEPMPIDYRLPVYLSFDFNVDPIVCLIAQHTPRQIRIIEEIRISDSNIFELCDRIRVRFIEGNKFRPRFVVTGDASGKSRHATSKYRGAYDIIARKLGVQMPRAFKGIWGANPKISETHTLTNGIFSHHPDILISAQGCPYFIEDLEQVEYTEGMGIDKSKDKRQSHLLDAGRYYFYTFHRDWIKHLRS